MHQAIVRRDVVVQLMLNMNNNEVIEVILRNVRIEDYRSRAQALPESRVPPEIIKLLPLDNWLDQLPIQTSATPLATPQNEEEAVSNLAVNRTNGVVSEKSSQD